AEASGSAYQITPDGERFSAFKWLQSWRARREVGQWGRNPMPDMKRREVIALLGSWLLAARAQKNAMPVIGFLHTASPGPYAHLMIAYRQGLKEMGYVEGDSFAIEYRWGASQLALMRFFIIRLIR